MSVSDAVSYCLIAIGEAARSRTSETQDRAPHLPWVGMIALRNVLAHKYHAIEAPLVYSAATVQLPAVIVATRALLDELPEETP